MAEWRKRHKYWGVLMLISYTIIFLKGFGGFISLPYRSPNKSWTVHKVVEKY